MKAKIENIKSLNVLTKPVRSWILCLCHTDLILEIGLVGGGLSVMPKQKHILENIKATLKYLIYRIIIVCVSAVQKELYLLTHLDTDRHLVVALQEKILRGYKRHMDYLNQDFIEYGDKLNADVMKKTMILLNIMVVGVSKWMRDGKKILHHFLVGLLRMDIKKNLLSTELTITEIINQKIVGLLQIPNNREIGVTTSTLQHSMRQKPLKSGLGIEDVLFQQQQLKGGFYGE